MNPWLLAAIAAIVMAVVFRRQIALWTLYAVWPREKYEGTRA